MKALHKYLDLDLAADSPAARDLLARLPAEARRSSLTLTGDGDGGATCANLTPAMNAWLTKHVAPSRNAALAAIQNAAARIRLPGNAHGIVADVEDDRLRRERNTRKAEETERFYEKHQADIDSLNRLQDEHDRIRAEEGNRDAKTPSRFIDALIVVLIAIPESFINYSSFFSWTGLGVVALGMTLVVALAIGLSSFLAGRFWKAYQFYMRPDDEDQKKKGLRMIFLSLTLLVIGLAFVGVARYRTVLEQVIQNTILGLPPPNIVAQTASLLVGNLLIFAIGAAFTYWIHDENPLFAEKASALRSARRAIGRAKAKELDAKLVNIERSYQQKKNDMMKKARLMDSQPDFETVADAMGSVAAKDGEVLGLLQDYRNRLADEIGERDPVFTFSARGSERQAGSGSGAIGLSEFSAMQLYLYRCNG